MDSPDKSINEPHFVSKKVDLDTFVASTANTHTMFVVTYEPMPIALESTNTERPYVFVQYIINTSLCNISRILLLEIGDNAARMKANMEMVSWLKGELFRYNLANQTYGQKLASDLGIRSSNSNPYTDYGVGVFGAGTDLDSK